MTSPFPSCCCWSPAGIASCCWSRASGRYRRLGTTIDDAAGEAFDKAAKLLGLGYPGGPALERAAAAGDPERIPLPRPMLGRPGCDFSFSGLKTALRHRLAEAERRAARTADLAASFQAAVDRLPRRPDGPWHRDGQGPGPGDGAGGGRRRRRQHRLRARLAEVAAGGRPAARRPAGQICTDNAAMIAWAGIERLRLGLTDGLDFAPRPRWPLDPTAKPGARA